MICHTISVATRKGLKEHYNLDSPSLAKVAHEATSLDMVYNEFVCVSRKTYPRRSNEHVIICFIRNREREDSQWILTEIGREHDSSIDETNLDISIKNINQIDLYVRARSGNIYPLKAVSLARR
ncbi:hypothetical protein OROHE_018952 [Orobanche hederae]